MAVHFRRFLDWWLETLTNNLNLDIDLDQALTERVDLDQTGVDSLVEAAKLGDKTNVALAHALVGVRADDAARNSTHSSNDSSESVDYTETRLVFPLAQ